MTTGALSPTPKLQFVDAAGAPLAGGLLYTYEAGTDTPLAAYTDSSASIAHTNPIVLDGSGRDEVWLAAVAYKMVLKTAAGVTVWNVWVLGYGQLLLFMER